MRPELLRVELASTGSDRCGEGPVWDAPRRRLVWTDIEGQVVQALEPASGRRSVLARGLSVSGIALHASSGFVLAGASGLHLLLEGEAPRPLLSSLEGEALSFNDVLADPRGRLYAGTIHWGPAGMERPGKLYLVDRDLSARVVDEGIELPNGLGLSPDGRTLYFTDSAARRIHAYRVDPETGTLSGRRLFVQVPIEEGLPDGLAVDAEGFVWSARWYGAQVVRYDPLGRVERRLPVPALQVASLAFGGDDLCDLYITTAAEPWRSPLAPPGHDFDAPGQGGALYRARPGPRGLPENRAALDPRGAGRDFPAAGSPV